MASSLDELSSYLRWCFLMLTLFSVISTTPVWTMCRTDERHALLQLKQSFSITWDASHDPLAYPKVASWGLHDRENDSTSTDCCSWDGVECDRETGHVIGLDLSSSYLKGSINSSSTLFHLFHLQKLNLGDNNFGFSQIPSQLRLLTSLTYLNLSFSGFSGKIPLELTELSNLISLDLGGNYLTGEIPSLVNLTHLSQLSLFTNQLIGQIPVWLSNISQVAHVNLQENQFHGTIPESIFSRLVNLRHVDLRNNYFTGTLNFDIFLGLKHLTHLLVTGNNLSLVNMPSSSNATSPMFTHLGLGNCQLHEFPYFLRQQDRLSYLGLPGNDIQGQIPKWIGDALGKTLTILGLAQNYLTGFEQSSMLSSFSSLEFLFLGGNKIQGPLPIPPPSIVGYIVSDNFLTGVIFPSVCDWSSLELLDLSSNNLSGRIPRCLGNFSDSLVILVLANNSLSGSIPETFSVGSNLRLIDLSRNRLEGGLPRSLANCRMLESLDLSENQISDTFPFWLGTLPDLQLLNLRSNQLFGAIQSHKKYSGFPSLRILDISCNQFTGILPVGFLQKLSSMKAFSHGQLTYMQSRKYVENISFGYAYELTLANKGIYMKYWKIPSVLAAIDLSSNGFQGHIPSAIGTLEMINVLNLSNNDLSGSIPSNLENLTRLESLDLSRNKFSGEIPVQLGRLTFLAHFNVSRNQLEGPIPQGKQFDTFENDSYAGNLGLCGRPLTRKCGEREAASPQHPTNNVKEDGKNFRMNVGLMMVLMGYGSGLVVGLVNGHRFTTRKGGWLLKKFGSRQRTQRGRRTSWTRENPGGRFRACTKFPMFDECNFFEWVNPPTESLQMDMDRRLLQSLIISKSSMSAATLCMLFSIIVHIASVIIETFGRKDGRSA